MTVPMPTRADVAEAERIVRQICSIYPTIVSGPRDTVGLYDEPRQRLEGKIARALSVAREEAQARHHADLTRIELMSQDLDGEQFNGRLDSVNRHCRERLAELTNAPPEPMP